MVYVGPLWRQPTETEWEDLQDRIEREVRPKMPALYDDRTMMRTQPGKVAVFNWKRDHKLLDEDNPLQRGRGVDPIVREDRSDEGE